MKTIDMRFDSNIFKQMIGQTLKKYRSDEFVFNNSVTGIIGIFVDEKVYEFRNEQKSVDYFGEQDDYAVFGITECSENEIKSFFDDTEQIDTPVNQIIKKITIINENQQIFENGTQTYNVWLTRGIIFDLGDREISFKKDTCPFSEEIEIFRGYDLISKFPHNTDFIDGWDNSKTPKTENHIITVE